MFIKYHFTFHFQIIISRGKEEEQLQQQQSLFFLYMQYHAIIYIIEKTNTTKQNKISFFPF